ncbi:MAG: methyltransferase domain-containing protein [Rhodospirillales bacterium]|nr:methyltransferase domain-containing protein [Rhodospirillales bacterium]
MTARDPHRFVAELDDATIDRLINRLESRGKDAVFTRLFDAYVARMRLSPSAQILEIGCGTGVVVRTLARREGFSGRVTGIDQSPAFIETARRLAAEEGLDQHVEFRVGDAHALEEEDGRYDAVIIHTVVSHVTDPLSVLREAARLVRIGGMVAVFDGDYESLTYAYPDHAVGRAMDRALVETAFNNPLVMRGMAQLLSDAGLELEETLADVVAEIGTGSYFVSMAETYAPMISSSGLLPAEKVDAWLAEQHRALDWGTFFAACNYYAFLARRPVSAG